MKTIPVSLIVVALLAPVVAIAQTEGKPPEPAPGESGAKHGPPRPFLDAWKAADSNHDGFLAKDEFDAMARIQKLPEEKRQHLFSRLDKDQDGKLSREELGRLGKPHDQQGPPMQRLWELDVDKSGGISFDEFKAGQFIKKLPPERQGQLFHRLDSNHDGLITPQDKPEPPFPREGGRPDDGKPEGPRMEPRKLLRLLDENQDGVLSLDEFRAGPAVKALTPEEQEKRFSALDHNHDQKLSSDDFPPPMPRNGSKPPEGPVPAPAPVPPVQ